MIKKTLTPNVEIDALASVIYKWIVKCKVNCKVNSGFWGIVSIFLGLQINIWIAYYCEFTLILIVHDHALWKWILAARAWLPLLCAARAPGRARFNFISRGPARNFQLCSAGVPGRLADQRFNFISRGPAVNLWLVSRAPRPRNSLHRAENSLRVRMKWKWIFGQHILNKVVGWGLATIHNSLWFWIYFDLTGADDVSHWDHFSVFFQNNYYRKVH